jgi:hypothetical protein
MEEKKEYNSISSYALSSTSNSRVFFGKSQIDIKRSVFDLRKLDGGDYRMIYNMSEIKDKELLSDILFKLVSFVYTKQNKPGTFYFNVGDYYYFVDSKTDSIEIFEFEGVKRCLLFEKQKCL